MKITDVKEKTLIYPNDSGDYVFFIKKVDPNKITYIEYDTYNGTVREGRMDEETFEVYKEYWVEASLPEDIKRNFIIDLILRYEL